MVKRDALLSRYREKLSVIPPPGGNGCHISLLSAANLGILAGEQPKAIFQDIRAAIPKGTRRVTDREILAAVERAAADHKGAITLLNGETSLLH
jgi:hypothetical protein